MINLKNTEHLFLTASNFYSTLRFRNKYLQKKRHNHRDKVLFAHFETKHFLKKMSCDSNCKLFIILSDELINTSEIKYTAYSCKKGTHFFSRIEFFIKKM